MKVLFLLSVLSLLAFESSAQVMTLSGSFNGKNLYIQNPESGDGMGYCVDSVKVNGQLLHLAEIESSAFEIPLQTMGFREGDALEILIYHQPDCKPKPLQPMICRSKDDDSDSEE